MQIHVNTTDGRSATLDALPGFRVMEIIRDWSSESGIGIKAECGGACACATCHVYVAPEWTAKLPDMLEEEEDRLDEAFDVEANSRLSCQLLMSEELDGLTVTVAPDAVLIVEREAA
ncbi:2Fe-2S iron-sulfur cluster-binding protein [Ahrensia sp. R2A130]|uniref:2Fe-2S iron-sulfur cluster-binding protein n=1 Tax=Ahrensia sp. R2A130 TaxID=744979 RepID=UPI0001E0D7F9|nr:2Fe-2S iron-sulfur cluster-binding protein [Ahrensia sp. R2A130]EFL90313.1 ferredoxin [Ahrensia sp. R2A130]